jgi:hypothetical protein
MRQLCAHGGRSGPNRRHSNADVRPSVSVSAQKSAAGGFLPVRFRADNSDTGLSLEARIVRGFRMPAAPGGVRDCGGRRLETLT